MDQSYIKSHQSILKDINKNHSLRESGYVTFPFLDNQHIQQLNAFFMNEHKDIPDYFYASTHSSDKNFRNRSSEFIRKIISPLLPDFLINYELLGGAFVVKPGGGKGVLAPHQDWNIVDEKFHRSYNLWIPLVDVNEKNGAVYILKASHSKMKSFRGPGIPSPFREIESYVWDSMTPLIMKAGEALLYDHALIHGSPANKTDTMRLGIVCGIVNKDVPMILYSKNQDNIVEYACNQDFYLNHNPNEAELVLSKNNVFKGSFKPLQKDEFDAIFKNVKKNKSIFSKIFGSR